MQQRTWAAGTALPKWVLITAIAPAVWGTTYVVTSELLPPGLPLWSSVLRALPAGLIGLLICRRLPSGHWWWRSLVMGMLNMGMFFPLLFVSAYRLPGGLAAVLSACQPLFVAALGLVLLRESPTIWRLLCGFAGVVGIALMVLDAGAVIDFWGVVAGIVGTGSMGAGIVLSKRWGRPVGALTWTSWLLAWSGLLLVPAALVAEGSMPALDGGAVAGYAWLSIVGGLLTYWAWFAGLSRLPTSAASFLPLLSPVVATLLGIALLGQQLLPVQWVGFCLCLAAICCAQLPAPFRALRSSVGPGPRNQGRIQDRQPTESQDHNQSVGT